MLRLGLEKLSQMPWCLPEAIKKRAIRYLLQRYVGQFLEETLSLEQLTVDLSQGTGTIKDLSLDILALNDVAEQLNLPFKFLDGYVSEICVSVPWGALLSENCFVEITGLALTLHPKQRSDDVSMVDSMIDSMSSSMQIAQECLNQVDSEETKHFLGSNDFKAGAKAVDGIEQFAHAIDTVLNRIKVRFINTVVRIEYAPSSSSLGIALETHFKTIDYFDEAGLEKDKKVPPKEECKSKLESQSFASKKFHVEGISFFTEVFSKSTFCETLSTNKDIKKSSEPVVIGQTRDPFEKLSHSLHIGDEIKSKIEPILFAKLSGRQEIRVRLKQSEEVNGPKVNFEVNCGSLVCFITPHQIHQLIELAEGIGSPGKAETPEKDRKCDAVSKQKPMNKGDFKRVEHELINFSKSPDRFSGTLNSHQGWSSPPGDESDDEFYPVEGANFSEKLMSNSHLSNCSDLQSSFNSTMSGSIFQSTVASNFNHKRGSKSKKKSKSSDSSCDNIITSFRIKFGSATFLILHEDILLTSRNCEDSASIASAADLRAKAESFFASLGPLTLNGHSLKEFVNAHAKLDGLCKLSHLRIMASPLVLDGYEKIVAKKWEFLTSFSVGYFDIKEYLNASSTSNLDVREIATFDSYDFLDGLHSMKPKIQLAVKKVQSKAHHCSIPKIELKATIDPCSIELDISIIDRITCIINRKKILIGTKEEMFSPFLPPSHLDNQTILNDIIDDTLVKSESKLNIIATSRMLELKIRFPIPDLRPASDMNRIPWWKRNVRKDILTLKFEDFYFETTLDHSSKGTSYEMRSRDILILFQEREENAPIPILRSMVQQGTQKGFDPARILVHCNPSKSWANLEDNFPPEEDLMTKSMMGFLEDLSKKDPSLFSTRKVASQQKDSVTEELTAPANKEEIYKFMDDCLQNVQYQLDISFPVVQVLLPSKHLCEVIYNRLVSDLLLWEPSAPNPIQGQQNMNGKMGGLDVASAFICNPFGQIEDSYNEDYDSIHDSNYYSVNEDKNKKVQKQNSSNHDGQTMIAVTVNVGKFTGILNTPYRDSNNKVLPGRHGEVVIILEDSCIFAASGYKGDYDLTYVSTLAKRSSVYHKANNPISVKSLGNPISTRNLSKVLYPSNHIIGLRKGVIREESAEGNFSFALKMDYDIVKNSKTILFAGGLRAMTLRHFMTSSPESWLSQLSDMFNVEDYPIAGYELPEAITELNFHLQHCQIEYQPLNLSLRAVACIDALSISSNLTISSNTSVLYFIMEDAGLFLSQNIATKDIDLKDLVCVSDLGVFEFCLKLTEEDSVKPIQELVISNNVVHIRTCADSCKALLEFIIYLANDGDLVEDPLKEENTPSDSVILNPTQSPDAVCPTLLQVHTNENEALKYMMQEAMLEVFPPKKNIKSSHVDGKGVEMFFFPDESIKRKILQNEKSSLRNDHKEEDPSCKQSALEEALRESMMEDAFDAHNSSTDDEFCILDGSTGSGIRSLAGVPQIKPLILDRFMNQGDYFDVPLVKTNHLKTPNDFPRPDLKYLLQELTVVWHLYGGNDFSPLSTNRKKVRISDRNGNHEVASDHPDANKRSTKSTTVIYSNGDVLLNNGMKPLINTPNSPPPRNSNYNWYASGGPGRCHSTLMEIQLSKVRFLYEVFPENAEQVCRHVLLIHDIEVRDRLATSRLNKFLYQYSSESCPRQSNANMAQVKAVTSRSDPLTSSQEMNLSVSIRPIRLHVDQDALLFLCNFFEQLANFDKSEFGEEEHPQLTSDQQAPVMNMNLTNLAQFAGDDQQLLVNIEERSNGFEREKVLAENVLPMYIKSFCFSPQVPIRIDYHGKRIDINSQYGALAGLIIGLGQLNDSEITLKRIVNNTGILGFNKLINLLMYEWSSDIKRNQLPSILGGIGPMHSFVKLFGGLKDLIWLPIEQYHKDGRVIRGIQRGTYAFTSSSAHAFLDLSGRFVSCIQSAAETMYDMVSSGPSDRTRSHRTRPSHPQDIREGVTTAFELVRAGLGDTANAIVRAAAEEHSHKGMSGAVGGVLRQIPPTVVQPIILASEATCTLIGGMKNQLVPNARKEASDKWKPR